MTRLHAAVIAVAGTLLLATAAATQPVPRTPSTPRAPGAPPAPAALPGAPAIALAPNGAAGELAVALLVLDTRAPRRTAAVVTLAEGLQIVTGARRGDTPAGSGRLVTVLADTLRGRRLGPAQRDALALGLAGALAAPGAAELDAAIASVRAALAAAGIGDADILLIDRELRGREGRR